LEFLCLITLYLLNDFKFTNLLGKEYLVTVVSAMGEEAVAAYKEAPKGKYKLY